MTQATDAADPRRTLVQEADRCVKCGLCLPHCPTYGLTRNEAESPRGRIALAEALARGTLGADARLLGHLDHCLLCRACERACPSQVRFGRLMDQTRALTLAQQPRWLRLAADLLSRRRLARFGLAAGRWWPAAWTPGGADLARAAQRLRRRQRLPRPVGGNAQSGPRVGLFLGCIGDAVQPGVARAARRLLESAGATVITPAGQTCCGALHGHLGDAQASASRARRNRTAFDGLELHAVVSLASGCGNQLDEQDPPLPATHQDVSQFLVSSGLAKRLQFEPLAARALLHTPCTLRNRPGAAQAVEQLLGRIPGLMLAPLDAGAQCCGAGGLHLISDPAQGAALRAPKLDAIAAAAPALLITSNPGCALHLAAGVGASGPEVIHPVELLARQLRAVAADESTPTDA